MPDDIFKKLPNLVQINLEIAQVSDYVYENQEK